MGAHKQEKSYFTQWCVEKQHEDASCPLCPFNVQHRVKIRFNLILNLLRFRLCSVTAEEKVQWALSTYHLLTLRLVKKSSVRPPTRQSLMARWPMSQLTSSVRTFTLLCNDSNCYSADVCFFVLLYKSAVHTTTHLRVILGSDGNVCLCLVCR